MLLSPVPREQDFEGHRAPGSREKVSLLAAVGEYIDAWTGALAVEVKPSPAQVQDLSRAAAELQRRSVSVGFGGLGHHLLECVRLLEAGAEPVRLRTQLGIVGELASQARQTLTSAERSDLSDAAAALRRPSGDPLAGKSALAPPPMITVMRQGDRAFAEAARAAARLEPPAEVASALPNPAPRAAAHSAPAPRSAPSAGAQFGVKNMLGLRGFSKQRQLPARAIPAPASGNAVGQLPLPPLPIGDPLPTGHEPSAPPRLVRSDILGLPALPPDDSGRYRESARKSGQVEQVAALLPARDRRRPAAPPRAAPRPPAAARPLRARPGTPRVGLWVGGVGVLFLAGTALVAFLVFGRRPKTPGREDVVKIGTSAGSPPESAASSPPRASGPAPPRERLIADDERFMSLLAQVHGHGGSESPELRSLLNDQAALASKALSGKCNDGSLTCKAWSDVRDLIVGNRKSAIVKRRRGSDTETTRSGWMAGLKMPAIPVEDDPRVLRVFEFYTQNPVGRETFQSMLFRCGAYRDLIQSTLIRYDLPPELLALVFTESGCESSAKSPVGAAGLWQFMPETGRAYHLNIVEGTIDERYSPFKSTEAGIRMLADLRLKLGSWDLVFASYNLGPFGVLARLEKAGADASFWDLVDADLLPDETANYAPTVDAIALILANLQRLKFAGVQIRAPQMTADLDVVGGTRLSLVARAAATSVAQLHALNLDFSGDVVPVIAGGSIAVQVPKDVVWQARDALKELVASKDGADQCVPATFDWGKQRFTPEMDQACQKRLSSAARETP